MMSRSLGRLCPVFFLTTIFPSTLVKAVMVVKETRFPRGDDSCLEEPASVNYEAPKASVLYGHHMDEPGRRQINCVTQALEIYDTHPLDPTIPPDGVMDLIPNPCIQEAGYSVKLECVDLGPTDFFVMRSFPDGMCIEDDNPNVVYAPSVGVTAVCRWGQMASCSMDGKLTLTKWMAWENCTGIPDSVEEYVPGVCNVDTSTLAVCGAFFSSSAASLHLSLALLLAGFLTLTTFNVVGH